MSQELAWAGDRPATPAAARERLLDAAARCIQRQGLARTGLSAVAAEAGVTRRTVYRYFDNRDVLVSGALIREVQGFTERARALLGSFDDPAEMVVEGLVFALRELPRDPVLGGVLIAGETILTEASLPDALAVLEPTIAPMSEAAGWTPEEGAECGELIMRLALSLLASPLPGRSEDELRGFLRRRVVPSLGFRPSQKN